MPPKKGKRGPKKGAKSQKVVEEEVEKTEVEVERSEDEEGAIKEDKLEIEDTKTKDREVETQDEKKDLEMRINEFSLDNLGVEYKMEELQEISKDNTGQVKDVDNKDSKMDNFNIDLDVEGSSPEMFVEPEPAYEQEMVQDFTLEELNQCLKEVTDSLLTFSKELEQLEEEEEEGAIKEDEVPFDRFPDVLEPSTVLLVLNLPPELDNDKMVKVFTNQSGLVSNATFVNKTQMRIHFKTQKAATAAKNTLDNLKLYNRKLQVLYARDVISGNVPSHMNFPYNISPNEFPERNFNKYQNVRNNYNEFNVPPPPTVGYTGPPQDRHKVVFNRYKLANNTLYKVLMQFYEEISSESAREKLRWDEKRPFYENLLRFDKMYEKIRISTRYLLLGNMREAFLEDSNRMHDFLARYTNTTYTYEYVMLPGNYPENNLGEQNKLKEIDNKKQEETQDVNMENPAGNDTGDSKRETVEMKEVETLKEYREEQDMKKWLLLVFDKNRDASVFYTKFMNSIKFFKEKMSNGGGEKDDPDGLSNMLIKYSCPMHALDTLWIGNVTDLCAYFAGEDEFYSFFSSLGTVKYFKLVYESSCMFVTFQDTNTSTKVYNFLNALSPKRAVRLYNLRNKNRMNLTGQDNTNNDGKMEGEGLQEEKADKENENKIKIEGMKEDDEMKRVYLQDEEHFLEVEKTDDLLNVDFSIGKSDNSYVLGQKLLNAIKRRSDSKELIENLLNTKEYSHYNRDQDYMVPRNGRQYRREYPEVWRRERGKFDRRFREPYGRDVYNNRDTYSKDREYGRYNNDNNREYNRDHRDVYRRDSGRYMGEGYNRSNREDNRDREYNRFRQRYPINKENRVDKFGRTLRPYDRSRRDDPWKGGKYNTGQVKEVNNRDIYSKDRGDNYRREGYEDNREDRETDEYRPAPPSSDMEMGDLDIDVKEPVLDNVEYCKLLKRGKYICTVNARYVRGDPTCRLPELLDVNQRANPERLKNCLGKSSELSLWKLGADSKEDNPKYESLCEYLISKNRVALVQEGPFDVYIVPPNKQFEQLLNTPDSDYMYAYILPRAP